MKLKRLSAAVCAAVISAGMVSCGSSDSSATADAVTPTGQEQGFVSSGKKLSEEYISAASDFSLGLFRKAAEKSLASGENVLVSPYSVILALGLAANGASGETLSEFEQVLGGGMKLDSIDRELNAMISRAGSDSTLSIANSIWVNELGGIKIKDDYAKKCQELLGAQAFSLPYNDGTLSKLNSWVSEKTNGMIPKMRDSLEADEIANLINCIAFESKWETQYEEKDIGNGTFTNINGDQQDCTMLRSKEHLYLQCSQGEGFIKLYKGGRYGFVAMLPNEGVALSELADSFSKEQLNKMVNSEEYLKYDVHVQIPEFAFDGSYILNDALKAIGLSTAFSDTANFSGMADEQLFISQVLHKTHITVDRKGTKAAAATDAIMSKGAISIDNIKQVFLDRPFLFAIIDMESELPIFIGALNSLK